MDLLFLILLTVACLSIAFVDATTLKIPNYLNLLIFVSGLFFAHAFEDDTVLNSLLNAIVVFAVLWGFSQIIFWIKGQIGFGMGDVKLISAATPWLGISLIPWMIFTASTSAIFWYFLFAKSDWKNRESKQIPFGPFLSFATIFFVWAKFFWAKNL